MTNLRSTEKSKTAIYEARQELSPFLRRLDLETLSRHNKGYLSYAVDPVKCFIDTEMHTHLKIVDLFINLLPKCSRIIDIGFFIPVVPIALAKLGFHVSSIEKLSFYGNALDEIIAFTKQTYNIELYDLDILHDNIHMLINHFDAVILSAILEHLNGTPSNLLYNAKVLGKKSAYYLLTVPNVASLRKRIAFLIKGLPPYPPISIYYHSEYPFTGHNREYTINDLKYVLDRAGFKIIDIYGHSRSISNNSSLKDRFILRIGKQLRLNSLQESIIALAQK